MCPMNESDVTEKYGMIMDSKSLNLIKNPD